MSGLESERTQVSFFQSIKTFKNWSVCTQKFLPCLSTRKVLPRASLVTLQTLAPAWQRRQGRPGGSVLLWRPSSSLITTLSLSPSLCYENMILGCCIKDPTRTPDRGGQILKWQAKVRDLGTSPSRSEANCRPFRKNNFEKLRLPSQRKRRKNCRPLFLKDASSESFKRAPSCGAAEGNCERHNEDE